ncbi:hypothetical protein RS130_11890 [Paraglaciecola aquimarina]|uniref:Uncharacterized protein n=1 Tax=Paraglaciecola aquimarina TaxID=1235557 RepID=A0ABU3SWZ6_9ALTE|nr:hypothetical protein [Paraglaciecola aquimarina]MDU0354541.1 hypothetical protein [Paraglaciecola aquimarina]
MTNERFDSRISPAGITEFAYGISWRHTSQASLGELSESQARSKSRNRYQESNQQSALSLRADNQTKLALEDKAVEGLKQKLRKESLCPKGYDISDVSWKADNIRLLGFCH